MNRQSSPASASRRFRNAAIAAATALFCSSIAGNAVAQVAVIDQPSITNNKQGFASQLAKTIDQYTKQIQQYTLQLQQYEQMLTRIENLGTNFQLTPNTMQPINAGPLIQTSCNTSGGGTGNLLGEVMSLVSQPTTQSQQQICAAIITAQVTKYNLTVQMLNNLQSYGSSVEQLDQIVSSISNMGQSSSATSQAMDLSNQLATQMGHWKAQMDAEDAVITSLQAMQSQLAQQAFNAKGDMQGDAVQAAALTAAFTY